MVNALGDIVKKSRKRFFNHAVFMWPSACHTDNEMHVSFMKIKRVTVEKEG
jgi:hypothetical protein